MEPRLRRRRGGLPGVRLLVACRLGRCAGDGHRQLGRPRCVQRTHLRVCGDGRARRPGRHRDRMDRHRVRLPRLGGRRVDTGVPRGGRRCRATVPVGRRYRLPRAARRRRRGLDVACRERPTVGRPAAARWHGDRRRAVPAGLGGRITAPVHRPPFRYRARRAWRGLPDRRADHGHHVGVGADHRAGGPALHSRCLHHGHHRHRHG